VLRRVVLCSVVAVVSQCQGSAGEHPGPQAASPSHNESDFHWQVQCG
jgi:hypothetical protein